MSSSLSSSDRILIVGAGLAGTIMAWELKKRQLDFEVWDSGAPSASRVAAGMYNPISFKRIVEVWNASEHIQKMHDTYHALEQYLDIKAVHKTPILRVFPNKQYRDLWQNRCDTNHPSSQWISEAFSSENTPNDVVAEFGFGIVNHAGWVNLPLILDSMKAILISEERFFEKSWNFSLDQTSFSTIIDCRGVGSQTDFSSHGLRLAADHGEVLTLSTSEENLDFGNNIINKVKWLLPILDSKFKLGATYQWGIKESSPSESGRSELLSAIKPVFSPSAFSSLIVEKHESGLRPASHDRRPYAGPSPSNPGTYILNGLGTRGVLIAPTTAANLAAYIFDGTPLPPEINPERVIK